MEAKTTDTTVKDGATTNPVTLTDLLKRLNDMAQANKKLMDRLQALEQSNQQLLAKSKVEPAKSKVNPNLKHLNDMEQANKKLLDRLQALEQSNQQLLSKSKVEPAKSKVNPKSPRRSPRKKRKSPPRKTPTRTPRKTKKKKLFEQKKKRTPKSPQSQKIRKTLGDTFKATYDTQLQAGKFKDSNGFFKLDLFDDCVRLIILAMQEDDEIDTTAYSYTDLYKMVKDAVKKRERYTPV